MDITSNWMEAVGNVINAGRNGRGKSTADNNSVTTKERNPQPV
jgi:hypothetical protein